MTGCNDTSREQATGEAVSAAADTGSAETSILPAIADNPLLEEWDTPFGVPPFDRIRSDHYLPALRATMQAHRREIEAITANDEPPSFANTVEALELSGRPLARVVRVFYAVNGANTDDTLQETAQTVAPEIAAHRDDILLDPELYSRIEAVHDKRDALDLGPEQRRLLEETHKRFVRAGAELEGEARERLREINAELASLSETFSRNLLAETNDFELLVTERADLGALPASLVAAAAAEARRRGHDCECWAFTLQRPSINPFLQYSPNRALREKIFLGYAQRGNNDNDNDNKAVLARMAALRAERAGLLGFESHAHYVLADNMAEEPDAVHELLDRIWPPALEVAKSERAALAEMMRKDHPEAELAPWDWRYYAEKVRQARYDYDEDALRPYFEFTAVRDGVFAVASRLFGLRFEAREALPRWHPDQQAFEVFDADGSHLAILYMDFFSRESKRGGAWMNDLRPQSKIEGETAAIVTNNFNFSPPTGDGPSLLSFREAQTLFHEFGHALHGMFSDVTYPSLSGTSTPRDFVEFPSQVFENWMSEPRVLRLFARHYETGAAIPEEIIEKIEASSKFNQGFATVEYIAASYLDMAYHELELPQEVDVERFEAAEMLRIGLIPEIIPRYRSTYFAHVFAGGYSAGYYSYLWSEVLDADAFEAFRETDLFDKETAARFRRTILSRGGTRPGMEQYREFRGRDPVIDPLLARRGLTVAR